MKMFVITVILIIIIAQPVFAAQTKNSSQDLENVKVLQTQLEVTKSFQNNLLQTVYWSLGTLATLAVLLVGFGWYTNFRVYERDKKALSEELHSQASVEWEKLRLSMESQHNEFSMLISEKIANEIQSGQSLLREQITSLKTSTENDIKFIKKEMKSDQHRLASEILEIKHDEWVKKKVFVNAFRCSTTILARTCAVHQSSLCNLSGIRHDKS